MSLSRKAKFAKAAYMIGKTSKVTPHSKKEVAALLNDEGVILEPDMSDGSITTLYESTTNTYHIAHKGTQFGSSTGSADGQADVQFALFGFNSHHVRDRTEQTEDILDKIDKRDPGATVTLQGHSLGGHTAAYAMANSDRVLKRVSSLDTLNTAAHPSYSVGLNVPFHKQRILDEKTTHHRMTADIVSKGHLVNLPFGTSKTYRHSTDLKLVNRALDAHHIDHFINSELVEKGTTPTAAATDPASPPPPTPTEGRAEQSGGTRALQAMTAGPGGAYVDPYWVCRRDPSRPECKAFI
jgi:hypothetical protein